MIEILIGPICSGKSTYAREAAKRGVITVNDDSIVLAVHGGDYTLYDKALKPLYRQIELNIITTAVAMGKHILIDRGNCCNAGCRRKYIALGQSLDIPVIAVVFANDGPAVHALRRFNADKRGHSLEYWTEVAERHQRDYQKPTREEGFINLVYHLSFR